MFSIIHKPVGKDAVILTYENASMFTEDEISKFVRHPELILIPINGNTYAAYVNEDQYDEDKSLKTNLVWKKQIGYNQIKDDLLILSGFVSEDGDEVSLTPEEIEEVLAFCKDTSSTNPKNKNIVAEIDIL